jgi:hypothetical protein
MAILSKREPEGGKSGYIFDLQGKPVSDRSFWICEGFYSNPGGAAKCRDWCRPPRRSGFGHDTKNRHYAAQGLIFHVTSKGLFCRPDQRDLSDKCLKISILLSHLCESIPGGVWLQARHNSHQHFQTNLSILILSP